jgi:hypothetical protein
MNFFQRLEKQIADSVMSLEKFAARWRKTLKVIFVLVFVIGLVVSASLFDFSWGDIAITPLVISVFVLIPVHLAISALSFQLSAKAVKQKVGFWHGVNVSALGTVAELLPIPGGAIVRSTALIRGGAAAGESAWIIALGAVLTLSLASLLGSPSLLLKGSLLGYLFVAVGIGGTLVSIYIFSKRLNFSDVVGVIFIRFIGLLIGIVRVMLSFAVIGAGVSIVDSALFVVSITLGSTSSIAPGGFGVSESIAAAMALLVSVPPEEAFIAVALNQVLGFVVCGFVSYGFLSIFSKQREDHKSEKVE